MNQTIQSYVNQYLYIKEIEPSWNYVLSSVIVLGIIFVVGWLMYLVLRWLLAGLVRSHLKGSKFVILQTIGQSSFLGRLVIFLLVYFASSNTRYWFDPGVAEHIVIFVCKFLLIILFALMVFTVLDIIQNYFNKADESQSVPWKGIIQTLKIITFVVASVFAVSLVMGQSPLVLFSGLGAMTAVLLLVFKDAILGLVAGILLSTNRMLKVGDWLQMDSYNANGNVLDISLTTVKVQNWDNTITTVPTYALISNAFINWQGMTDSGGRRIARNVYIDANSVRFLTKEELDVLQESNFLSDYLKTKYAEITKHNQNISGSELITLDGRRLTNFGTLRAYLIDYLKKDPRFRTDMTQLVRQMKPSKAGLPLQIYVFTNTVDWNTYEGIQSDLFDHIYAILPAFGLRVYQKPSSGDLFTMLNEVKAQMLVKPADKD